jgi:hypothetical protein
MGALAAQSSVIGHQSSVKKGIVPIFLPFFYIDLAMERLADFFETDPI